MTWSETSTKKDDVAYVGMRIRVERPPDDEQAWVRLSIIPKDSNIRYTHPSTTAPAWQPKGVFKSALIRALRLTSNWSDLLVEIQRVVYSMLDRGHEARTFRKPWQDWLNEEFREFPQSYEKLKGFLRTSVHRHEMGVPRIKEKDFIGRAKPTEQGGPLSSGDQSPYRHQFWSPRKGPEATALWNASLPPESLEGPLLGTPATSRQS